jgi:hypothetical protein
MSPQKFIKTNIPKTKQSDPMFIQHSSVARLFSITRCDSISSEKANNCLFLDYESDINDENPLGTGGKMANAFYYLLTQLWSGRLR